MAVQKHNTYYDNELYYYDEHGIRQPLQVGKVYSAGSGINIDENDVISISADYLSASEIENYYKKSETSAASSINAKFDEVTAWADETFLKEHQSLDGVSAAFSATSAWARNTFQLSGDYVSAAEFNTFKESVNQEFTDTSAWANKKFQLSGNYVSASVFDAYSAKVNQEFTNTSAWANATFLTAHQSLDGVSAAFSATSAWANKTFQPSGSYYQTFETSSKNEIQSALDLKLNIADMSAYQISGNYVSATVFNAYSADVKQEFTNTSAWANDTFQPSGKYITSASDEFAGKTIALKDNQWIEITAKDWTNEISAASANAIDTSITSATTLINSAVDAINQEFENTSAWANNTFQPSGNYLTELVTELPLSGKGTQDEPLSVNMSAIYSTEFSNGLTAVLDTSARTLTIQMTDEAWNDYQHLHTSASLWDSISALPVLSGLCITSAVSIVKGKFDLTENNTASGYDGIPFQQSSLDDYYTKSETSGKNEIQNALDLKQDVSGMSAYQLSGKYVTSAGNEFSGKTIALKDNAWIEITAKDWTNEISAASANAITSAYTSATTLVNSAVNTINNQFSATSAWANKTFQLSGNYVSATTFNAYSAKVNQEFSATSAWANHKFQPSGAYLTEVAVDVDAPIAGNGTMADPLRMDMSATYSTEFDKGITAVLDKNAHTLTIQMTDDVWNDYQLLHTSTSSWNNVSAYAATSGNFVTSAIAQFQDNIAYFLAKSGTSTVWSAVDIAAVMSGTSVTVKSIREFNDVVGTHLNGGVEVTLEWNENGNLLTSSFSAFNGLNGADVMLYDSTTLSGNGDTSAIGVNTNAIATKQYVDNNFVPVTATTVAIGTDNVVTYNDFAQGVENSAYNNCIVQGNNNIAYDHCIAQGDTNSAEDCSFSQGAINYAHQYSIAQGYDNTANNNAFAQGLSNGTDTNSLAQGESNSAYDESFAQGSNSYAYNSSIAQGIENSAEFTSFAQGYNNSASNEAFAQGESNTAVDYSLSLGLENFSNDKGAAVGYQNSADYNSFAQGYINTAYNYGFAQGFQNTASYESFAQGYKNYAGDGSEGISFAQGSQNSANYQSFAQGISNTAYYDSFAQGYGNSANDNSLTQGLSNTAYKFSFAAGEGNYASLWSNAQGDHNTAYNLSFSQGYKNYVALHSFAQGKSNSAQSAAFALGEENQAHSYTFSEGYQNSAYVYSFAHGTRNYAYDHSFAFGDINYASNHAYTFGYFNKAYTWSMEVGRGLIFRGPTNQNVHRCSLIIGAYNKTSANALFVVGNGNAYDTASRHDAFTVDLLGNVYAAGNISANGIDISATYATKSEVSAQLGDIETLLAAL